MWGAGEYTRRMNDLKRALSARWVIVPNQMWEFAQ